MQLADLGADVVKIENPAGGDNVRLTPPFVAGESSNFIRLNRNKRSLALDLKDPAGKAAFRRLAVRTDIVVENLRPGTMAGLGLDYPQLAALNPGLIYVAASGWGRDGPYSRLAGLDIMAQGMSGLMSITGTEGGDPVKVGVPVCDLACALYGALAAVSALEVRRRDGKGQLIDVSLFEAGVSLAVWEAGRHFATGEIPRAQGSAHQSTAPYQAFRAADGFFTAGVPSPKLWSVFLGVLGLDDLAQDPRFTSNAERLRHRDELARLIEEVTTRQPVTHWLAAFQAGGVPCNPIQDYGQVFSDPHLESRSYFWEGQHPTAGAVRQLGSPMRMSETPTRRDWAGPLLGQHSAEVLGEVGYGPDEIAVLRESGVIA